jgi:hypothetical protein
MLALDVEVVRKTDQDHQERRKMLEMFTNPRGVAVVGASASPGKLGYSVLNNVIQYGYKGAIYPVNPKADEILGTRPTPPSQRSPVRSIWLWFSFRRRLCPLSSKNAGRRESPAP